MLPRCKYLPASGSNVTNMTRKSLISVVVEMIQRRLKKKNPDRVRPLATLAAAVWAQAHAGFASVISGRALISVAVTTAAETNNSVIATHGFTQSFSITGESWRTLTPTSCTGQNTPKVAALRARSAKTT